MKTFPIALVSLVFAATVACEPKGGGNNDDAIGDGGVSCVDTPTVIESVDELSDLGFSAAEVLALAEGEHTSPIFWNTTYNDGGIDLEIGPESGEVAMTITVAHDGGEIRYVKSEPDEGDGSDIAPASCADRLEIDVTAMVTTAGGALAESIEVTLRSDTDLYTQFSAKLDLGALDGSFSVVDKNAVAEVGPATLDVTFSDYGISGGLSGQLEMEGDGWVGVGFVQYATFPSAEPRCEFGEIPIPFDGVFGVLSASDALDLVNRDWIFELRWDGGEGVPLELSAVHDGAEVCAAVNGDYGTAGSLRVGATVDLATEDGTVAASIPVVLTAEPGEDGELAQVHIANYAPYGSLVPVAEFPTAFGEFGVDVSGYDLAGVDFNGAFAPFDDPGSADGSLTILGGTDPDCSDEPGAGCPGWDTVEVARAEWGNTGVGG